MEIEIKYDDINGIVKRSDYALGYVAAVDILGFSDFVEDTKKYCRVRDLMNHIAANKKIFESNFEHLKFNLCSDTVFVTIEVDDLSKFDYAYFESIISKIGLIRSIVLNELGLYSRAGITFGKYIVEAGTHNIVFGPAIVRAVQLAEHMDKMEGVMNVFANRPAAICIDNCFLNYPDADINEEMLNGGIKDWIFNSDLLEHIGNDYYIYNPYFEDFYSQNLINESTEEEFRVPDFLDYYIKRCKERINRIKEIIPEKVIIEERQLDDFIKRQTRL